MSRIRKSSRGYRPAPTFRQVPGMSRVNLVVAVDGAYRESRTYLIPKDLVDDALFAAVVQLEDVSVQTGVFPPGRDRKRSRR